MLEISVAHIPIVTVIVAVPIVFVVENYPRTGPIVVPPRVGVEHLSGTNLPLVDFQGVGLPIINWFKGISENHAEIHAPTERLEEVVALLPGAERPTILPLAGDKQRVAMHMVSSETLFWETMEKLKALGASSILVLPIEKMME